MMSQEAGLEEKLLDVLGQVERQVILSSPPFFELQAN